MPGNVPRPTPIYHITHVSNLDGILSEGVLWSDRERIARGLVSQNIGYEHIKQRRLSHPVSVAAGGTVGDYAPFNFCPRSIMLYVVSQGTTQTPGGQTGVVHLVSSVESVCATGRPWFFTDRHADLAYATQLDDLARLSEVDWQVMPVRFWGGDTDLKERRQAEFLVHNHCPWAAFAEIGVMNTETKLEAERILAKHAPEHVPPVVLHRDWYY